MSSGVLRRLPYRWAGFAVVAVAAGAQGQSAKFVVISPPVAGAVINPYGISDDGSTVVGAVFVSGISSAFRWTEAAGVELLGPGYALDANEDGSVVVGGKYVVSASGSVAMRWSGGVAQTISGGHVANAVSADGSVIVGGTAQSAIPGRAFRWTTATGMQLLPPIEPGTGGYAHDISADGTVIVGFGNPSSGEQAFRWSAATGTLGLGYLPSGATQDTIATSVSADGSVIAGYGDGVQLGEAFRWASTVCRAGAGCVGLGVPRMLPRDMSGDGSVIVGEQLLAFTALIWDQHGGVRPLKEDLEARFGLVLTGWTLQAAGAITADGTRIAGYGTDPAGQRKAFLVTLSEAAGGGCYPDCNEDGALNVADFGCFQARFAVGDAHADCNWDGVWNLSDFGCFTTKFAVGCP